MTVTLQRRGAVATIELNRPDAMNAWNREFGEELRAVVERTAADADVRAVVITGAGRAFSAGADLKDTGFTLTAEGHPDVRQALTERYHPIITGIREMPKPVIAAVNGPAAGIGCSLALACDLVLARESAYLLLAFVNIGLVPDGGSSVFVPARAGAGRAAVMAMLGERIPAAQAQGWGLVDLVAPDADFAGAVDALEERLATGPTRSYAASKVEVNARAYANLDEQLELEASLQEEMAGSGDFAEGVAAFLEKRTPRFAGE